MVSKDEVKSDIKALEKVATAMANEDFVEAFVNCVLIADIYYKPVGVIQSQLYHNIKVDVCRGTSYAFEYANHLKNDAERFLENMG